jgi:hypothetical protein
MKKLLFLAVFIGLLVGCSSVSVKRDFDAGTDFRPLKTFAWQHDEQPETGNPQIDNDLNDERIRAAVKTTLVAKGFRPASRADADVLVAYFMDHKRTLSSGSVSVGMGRSSYGRHGSVGYSTGVSEYDQAILTLDILNPEDERMIWRGVGSRATYTGSSPKKSIKIINEAVEKILKKFPPKQK